MPAMRGNEKVLRHLGQALKAELTAHQSYFLHSKMCENWGYFRLGGYYRKNPSKRCSTPKVDGSHSFPRGTPNMTEVGPIQCRAQRQAAIRE
jgi:bacterioferritin